MNNFHNFGISGRVAYMLALLAGAACFAMARPATAQVVPSADVGNFGVSAGGTASGYFLQYGERKMLGASAFVDLDTIRHFGFEGEARWLVFHQTENVNSATYLAGPRVHMNFGRFQPYAKGLVGLGEFNFPYNLAHGSYLVVAPGGGVDYHVSKKVFLRVADFEYDYWPQFTFGAMRSYGISTGIRVRIF
jgi:hypothetical protein